MLTSISKVIVGMLWFVGCLQQIYDNYIELPWTVVIVISMLLAWRLVRTGACDICRIIKYKIKRLFRKLSDKEVTNE